MRIRLLSLLLLVAAPAWASAPSRTYTYTTGQTIDPSQVTTNEDNIFSYLQGGVDTYSTGSVNAAAIGTDAVGTSELASTAVSAGSYTFSSITVDADGRVTAASSGTPTTDTDVGGSNARRVHRTAGDVSTNSTSLVDFTGASITITTAANPVQVAFTGSTSVGTPTTSAFFNVDIDGTLQLGTVGVQCRADAGALVNPCGFTMQTAALTAGSHTIKLQWKVSGDTWTTECNTSDACNFSVMEVLD